MNVADQRIALVTGANRGLGLETSRQLARANVRVLLAARDFGKASGAARELQAEGLAVTPVALDVASEASVAAAAATVRGAFGRVDIVVNNAGINFDLQNTALAAEMDFVRTTFETNLLGAWRVTRAFMPLLRESNHAVIVNVSSEAASFQATGAFGLVPLGAAAPVYGVSKAALNALTIKLALELKPQRILVNAVCPGWTATYEGGLAQGARPVQEGAASIVWAALLPVGGPTGGFFRDGRPLAW